jgi:hypothetical protein
LCGCTSDARGNISGLHLGQYRTVQGAFRRSVLMSPSMFDIAAEMCLSYLFSGILSIMSSLVTMRNVTWFVLEPESDGSNSLPSLSLQFTDRLYSSRLKTGVLRNLSLSLSFKSQSLSFIEPHSLCSLISSL